MVDIKIGSQLMAADEFVKSNNSSRSFLSLLQTLFKLSQRGRQYVFKSKRLEDPQAKIRKSTLLYSRPRHHGVGRLKRTTSSLLYKVSEILYGPA